MLKNDSLTAASFVLSLLAIVFSVANFNFSPSTDTFVGTMASLIGICATIIVGAQIFNSIETKRTIKDLEESYREHVQEIEGKIKETENRLRSFIEISQASSIFDYQPIASFVSLHIGMEHALEAKDKDTVEVILSNIKRFKNAIFINLNADGYLDLIAKEDEKTVKSFTRLSIRKSAQNEIYDNIKEEYEQIISETKSRVITKMEAHIMNKHITEHINRECKKELYY